MSRQPTVRAVSLALSVALVSSAAAPAARAQGVPTRTLAAKPDAALEEPFSAITAIRELRDGRVLVTDAREKALRLVDLARGTVEQVGREGGGPGEYASVGRLFALPGDTTWLLDTQGGRMLVIGPDAQPRGTIAITPENGLMAARFTDREGRLFGLDRAVTMTPQGPQTADSASIFRLDRGASRRDTLPRVKLPATRIDASQRNGQIQSINITRPPMPSADDWAVFPDGRIVVARVAPYRVDMISPAGALTQGPALPHQPIRVTEADRAAARSSRGTAPTRIGVGSAGGNPTRSHAGTPLPGSVSDPSAWPEFKPPFLAPAVIPAWNGEAWVQRTMPAGGARTTYDVIGADGRLLAHVSVPSTHRVLAVTARGVYVARSDADDLLYLERYPHSAR